MAEAGTGTAGAEVAVRRPPLHSSTLLLFAAQLAISVLSFANVLIIARALGPTGRGAVAFLVAVAYLTSQLATLGVQWAHANFAGRDLASRPALATNSALLALALGTVAGGILIGLVELVPALGGHVSHALLWLAIGVVPVLIFQNYLLLLVQAEYGFRLASASWLVPPLLNVLVNGSLATLGLLSVRTAFLTWVAGQVLGTLLLLWYIVRRSAGFGRPDRRLAQEAFVFGAKAHLGRVMLLGNYRLDQWILGAVSGTRELGVYSVAVAWAETLFLLPTVLMTVLRPDFVRAARREAGSSAATAVRAAMLVTLPLAVGVILAAPVLCVTFFGDGFRGSVDQLRILAAGAFGILTLKVLGTALTAQGKPLLETAAVGTAFVVTVGLDVLLIPSYGGIGAALASTLAYTLGGIAVVAIFARALGPRLPELIPRGSDLGWVWSNAREAVAARQEFAVADQAAPDGSNRPAQSAPARRARSRRPRRRA